MGQIEQKWGASSKTSLKIHKLSEVLRFWGGAESETFFAFSRFPGGVPGQNRVWGQI